MNWGCLKRQKKIICKYERNEESSFIAASVFFTLLRLPMTLLIQPHQKRIDCQSLQATGNYPAAINELPRVAEYQKGKMFFFVAIYEELTYKIKLKIILFI